MGGSICWGTRCICNDRELGRARFFQAHGLASIRVRGAASETSAREPLRLALKRGLKERPQWTEESRAWVIGQVRGDAQAFLKWCGRDGPWPSVAE
jgi:hypothetical protein